MEPGSVLARKGSLCVRLARSASEIVLAQELRYRVFYEELSAKPDAAAIATRRDTDKFDAICDHLIAVDSGEAAADGLRVEDGVMVGTYRLLRQSVAEAHGGFYTASEFDIGPMLAAHPKLNFLELGRSCVLKPYRTKPAVEMLWQGIWNYVRGYGVDVMFGCASLEGADPRRHEGTLAFLAGNFAPPPEWSVRALPSLRVNMRNPSVAVDIKQAMRELPPLIKGYLRLGCYIGDGAVIDRQFDTVDVLIVLPVSNIDKRYFAHFGQPDEVLNG
ncbi:MAG: GNAT family N-acetyltransferase [Aestuariivirga sp.]